MKFILTIDEVQKIADQERKSGKTIVLTGGCFDILHPGHLSLLQHAKKQGDVLFVMLESDETIVKLKGNDRPIFPQLTRANLLAELRSVDYVVLLKPLMSNTDYDRLVKLLKPA